MGRSSQACEGHAVVQGPGPPGLAAASDAAQQPSISTVTSWSKVAAGPCPPCPHTGHEEEARVVRGGTRPGGVGSGESASSVVCTTQLFPSHRPEHRQAQFRGRLDRVRCILGSGVTSSRLASVSERRGNGPGEVARGLCCRRWWGHGPGAIRSAAVAANGRSGCGGKGGLGRSCPGREEAGGRPAGFCELGAREWEDAEITPGSGATRKGCW